MGIILLLLGLYYVDQPYPAVPEHSQFDIQLRFGPEGEILGFFNIGIWDRFGFGLSYGASNLIGAGNPDFYTHPGVQIRLVAIPEGLIFPLLIFGFDNQGYGPYNNARYQIRSKGLYGQLAKTLAGPGIAFVPSLGINYTFESDDGLNLFIGSKLQLGENTAILLEYDPNFNDPEDQNKGYLNAGLRIIFYEELFFELGIRDLLDNAGDNLQFNRMIKLGYEQTL